MTDTDIVFLTDEAKTDNTSTTHKTDIQWLFSHGAGAPMDSAFMNVVAQGVATAGITVKRFEFPYMDERRKTGKKRPPNRAPELLQHFMLAIEQAGGMSQCVIGGKSMGGRMASLLAAENPNDIMGVVCLGYPFHPVGKLEKTRIDHFSGISVPHCIVQGTRDALGTRDQVESYGLPEIVDVHWLEDGDHDLKPRKKSGLTHEEHIASAIAQVVTFILSADKRQKNK
jgi:predicted alpha/beta-hydrolase family hydrolase